MMLTQHSSSRYSSSPAEKKSFAPSHSSMMSSPSMTTMTMTMTSKPTTRCHNLACKIFSHIYDDDDDNNNHQVPPKVAANFFLKSQNKLEC